MIFNTVQAALAFVLVLGPLVFIHEFGHFIVAKWFRIGVPVFSLGFGPRLFGFRRRETDYRLSLIPLGGYVRLAGDESDDTRIGAPEEFLSRPRHERFAVFVAGATFNIALAFCAMWLFFGVYGKEQVPEVYPTIYAVEEGSTAEQVDIRPGDRIVELGGIDVKNAQVFLDAFLLEVKLSPDKVIPVRVDRDGVLVDIEMNTGSDPKDGSGEPGWSFTWEGSEPAVIADVVEGDPADLAGLKPGDRIIGIGDREPVDRIQLQLVLLELAGKEVELRVERAGEILAFPLVPREREGGGGWIGIVFRQPDSVRVDLSMGEAATEAYRMNIAWSKTLFVALKRLVTREVSLKTMSGPIGIAQFARQALIAGPQAFLWLLGFVSLQLGILNLLPIPVLDGGHILILGVESVMRRDLSDRLKERVMQAGFVFLLAFMGVVVYLDIVKSL